MNRPEQQAPSDFVGFSSADDSPPLLPFGAHELRRYDRSDQPVPKRLPATPSAFQLELFFIIPRKRPGVKIGSASIREIKLPNVALELTIKPVNWLIVERLDKITQFGGYISLRRNRVLTHHFISITADDPLLEEVSNRLYLSGIRLVGDVVQLSREQITDITAASPAALDRLTDLLAEYGLSLGKQIPGWSSERISRD